MNPAAQPSPNVRQVVPFFRVSDMQRSVRFYLDALGFSMKHQWVVDGTLRWCWLTLGGASLMLQEFSEHSQDAPSPGQKVGLGVSLCFQCEDALALYREFTSRGVAAQEPFVGNRMWVVMLSSRATSQATAGS
jgi:catechol 2,3-dioxygenase-like lactoylglutathione lyase family enzyme